MRQVLGLCLCALLSVGAALAKDEPRWAIGGGYVGNNLDVDGGDDADGDGVYGTLQVEAGNGIIVGLSLSRTSVDETQKIGPVSVSVDDDLWRTQLYFGYLFRRYSTFRPFAHGGLSYVHVEEKVEGIQVIDDASIAFSVGAGFELGKGQHAFFLDVSLDVEQEVRPDFGGAAKFDLIEAQLGYMYRY